MSKTQVNFIAWRFYLVIIFLITVVLGLIWRILDLTIFDQHFLRHQGEARVLRLVSTPAFRGMILDRNGLPLAVSTSVYSVWFNPKEFNPNSESLSSLSKLLEIKTKEIKKIYSRYKKTKREFIYLKRGLSPELANTIKSLSIPGIYTQIERRRYYPEGEAAAHLVGFTNVDDQGQEGLELAYNQWLMGEPGKKWVVKDRLGRVISDVRKVQEAKAGNDLTLSIDRRIQYLAYRELLTGIKQHIARSGSVVVLDAKTGEILAIANYPSFNPNNRSPIGRDSLRNRAITDTFEPGSTIKAFSIATALDSGKYKPDTIIDTYPGWIQVDHRVVKDEHQNGPMSVMQILQKSSNVGTAKMILSLPPNQLWNLLHRVGFGEVTGVGFPGEQSGSLVKHNPWGAFTVATLSFGYGIAVTPLQLTIAYSVIANLGIKRPVTLLRIDHSPAGESVMNREAASQMLMLLETVVNSKIGTGKSARISGYRVAGKTGTSDIAKAHGYAKDHVNSSFVGIAPVSNPKLIVSVIISDPNGKYHHGGDVSGPVFQRIMEGSLRILNVSPDA
jgi:cell division protein FtsI (penicillin-binding protein 3)